MRNWIDLALDIDYWTPLVNAALNLGASKGKCLFVKAMTNFEMETLRKFLILIYIVLVNPDLSTIF